VAHINADGTALITDNAAGNVHRNDLNWEQGATYTTIHPTQQRRAPGDSRVMSSSTSKSQERILERFNDAWNGPAPPSIEDYMRTDESLKRLPLLVELIHIDLERRLTSGESVHVEEAYLRRFPELNADRAAVVALAAREFELRRRRDPNLSLEDFLQGWPQCRDELALLFRGASTIPSVSGNTSPTPPPFVPGQRGDATRDVLALLAPPQASDEIGRLGGYRVLKFLGSGGMGVVFHAEDAQLKRPVAL
jgi:hypothetical protein